MSGLKIQMAIGYLYLFFNTIKKDMIEFHNTGYGRKFYEADIPRIVKALERIAVALEKLDNDILSNKSKESV